MATFQFLGTISLSDDDSHVTYKEDQEGNLVILSSDSEPEPGFSFSEYLKQLKDAKEKVKEEENDKKRENSVDEPMPSPKKARQ